MKVSKLVAFLAACAAVPVAVEAQVVINEVFYHAPEDVEDLEWVEVHNAGKDPVDLSGWAFKKGVKYTFPKDTKIEAGGYVVVCRNLARFQRYYQVPALGGFDSPLSDKGEQIELADATGKVVDAVKYDDKAPWPASADGCSASLERICPTAAGNVAENWTGSPLSANASRPGGTPGQRNACCAEQLPPVISKVTCTPEDPAPGQAVRIEAEVRDADGVGEVNLLYRVALPNSLGKEVSVTMAKESATGRYSATIPGQEAGRLVRYRVNAVDPKGAKRLCPAEHDLRPTFSLYVHEKYEVGTVPFGLIMNVGKERPGADESPRPTPARRRSVWGNLFGGNRSGPPTNDQRFRPPIEGLPAQGLAAFIYVDQKTGKQTVFDHINITERNGGYKVRFHKDQTLNGMSTISLLLEQNERFVLAEPLSYELYRRVGNAAPQTDFVRLWHDGQPMGYHLLVEQPNKSFLRRNKVRDDGNLYKVVWVGQGVVGQHEKKTNRISGHDDVVALVNQLRTTRDEEQWKVIEKSFNVPQAANFFAVNMCISDWDGFFNNYFTYHDLNGTKKWELYPWDRDKTWGYHDGIFGNEVFTDMPLTFGMQGDRPPARGGRGGFGPFGGTAWWRPGGYFSAPLLANPQFRKVFLTRTKEICETVYTKEVFFPIMEAMEKRLEEEVRVRAKVTGMNPEAAVRQLHGNMESLREHLVKRREYILSQPEIQALGKGKE